MLQNGWQMKRQKVQDVLHYIDHHIDGDLSIRTLSEKFHISVYHFHRIMKAAFKEMLGSYIDHIRLEIEAFVKNHCISFWRPELFAIYYDDPDVVDPSLCRSDVCLVVRKPCFPEGRVGVKSIPGGKFAVFWYQGPYEYLWELYAEKNLSFF